MEQPAALRLLSFNIQVGLQTGHWGHYLTRAWKHVLPSRGVRSNLDRIAALAAQYDVVALQEADAGSLRTQFLNQVEYLAQRAGFAHWRTAVNRNLGPFAQHCLGVIARYPLLRVSHHSLPGRVRGRGALEVDMAFGAAPLRIISTHLALTPKARHRQLDFLGRVASGGRTVILGDFNCDATELAAHPELRAAKLLVCEHGSHTYPSWQPQRCLDHILVSDDLTVTDCAALDLRYSDHRPVAVTLHPGERSQ